uniref:RAP domain-containing protein n=1 Tax=Chromera velia CCMP2878 TaxID=1169474 RepID=A0A0G4FCY9_9ALVE|eukprot:Cvel_16277.t1-p1 / transcript=Cvel_16277.t1 / gene=Cvel_16277 / organism=Chromera_velia_CCMP2878 / gene_product=hypothetical protein / transcript_product=hypothetical protein / location=Cvel_scaffold1246:14347-32826(-) / protein_length=1647 / sequence_SO=supercontig / SO=protein_coding / is_pseudo=false
MSSRVSAVSARLSGQQAALCPPRGGSIRLSSVRSVSRKLHTSRSAQRKITVIPMDPKEEKAPDQPPHPDLPPLSQVPSIDRHTLVRTFQKLQEVPFNAEYWEAVCARARDKTKPLLPSDVAEILQNIAAYPGKEVHGTTATSLLRVVRQSEFAVSSRDAVSVVHACGKLGLRPRKTLWMLYSKIVEDMKDLDATSIRRCVRAIRLLHLRLDSHPVFPAFLKKAGDRSAALAKTFTPTDFLFLLNTFAFLRFPHEKLFQAAAQHAALQSGSFSATELAIVANAYAQMEIRNLALLRSIADCAVVKADELNTQNMSNLVNAFAKLEFIEPRLFAEIAPRFCAKVRESSAQSLSNVAGAYAKAGVKHDALFKRIGMMATRKMGDFNGELEIRNRDLFASIADEIIFRGTIGRNLPHFSFSLRSLSQIAHAFAKMGLQDRRVFFVLVSMMKQAGSRAEKTGDKEADGQTLAMILRAFSMSGYNSKDFEPFITTQVLQRLHLLSTDDIASVAHACGKLGIKHEVLFKDLMRHSKERVQLFTPTSLCRYLRSLYKLGVYKRTFVRRSLKHVSTFMTTLQARDLVAASCGLAELGYRDVLFLSRLWQTLMAKQWDITPGLAAQALVAAAKLRHCPQYCWDVLMGKVFEGQHRLQAEGLFNVLHAVAIADTGTKLRWKEDVFASLLNTASEYSRSVPLESVSQLQIIDLWLRLLHTDAFQRLPFKSKDFLRKVRRVSPVTHTDFMGKSSRFHKAVSKALNAVGLVHRSEILLGPYSCDVLIGNRLIVEVDGPNHFYRDTNMRTAVSILKHKILEGLGFTVRRVTYQEWEQCVSKEQRKMLCVLFWKDVLGDQLKGQAGEDGTRREPQISDIVHLVAEHQKDPLELISDADAQKLPPLGSLPEGIRLFLDHEDSEGDGEASVNHQSSSASSSALSPASPLEGGDPQALPLPLPGFYTHPSAVEADEEDSERRREERRTRGGKKDLHPVESSAVAAVEELESFSFFNFLQEPFSVSALEESKELVRRAQREASRGSLIEGGRGESSEEGEEEGGGEDFDSDITPWRRFLVSENAEEKAENIVPGRGRVGDPFGLRLKEARRLEKLYQKGLHQKEKEKVKTRREGNLGEGEEAEEGEEGPLGSASAVRAVLSAHVQETRPGYRRALEVVARRSGLRNEGEVETDIEDEEEDEEDREKGNRDIDDAMEGNRSRRGRRPSSVPASSRAFRLRRRGREVGDREKGDGEKGSMGTIGRGKNAGVFSDETGEGRETGELNEKDKEGAGETAEYMFETAGEAEGAVFERFRESQSDMGIEKKTLQLSVLTETERDRDWGAVDRMGAPSSSWFDDAAAPVGDLEGEGRDPQDIWTEGHSRPVSGNNRSFDPDRLDKSSLSSSSRSGCGQGPSHFPPHSPGLPSRCQTDSEVRDLLRMEGPEDLRWWERMREREEKRGRKREREKEQRGCTEQQEGKKETDARISISSSMPIDTKGSKGRGEPPLNDGLGARVGEDEEGASGENSGFESGHHSTSLGGLLEGRARPSRRNVLLRLNSHWKGKTRVPTLSGTGEEDEREKRLGSEEEREHCHTRSIQGEIRKKKERKSDLPGFTDADCHRQSQVLAEAKAAARGHPARDSAQNQTRQWHSATLKEIVDVDESDEEGE